MKYFILLDISYICFRRSSIENATITKEHKLFTSIIIKVIMADRNGRLLLDLLGLKVSV